ncbi:MAG: peptidylprolyl isomerase [Balneolaceae bacterium]
MKNKYKIVPLFLFSLLIATQSFAQQAPQLADRIVAHVNDKIILKSEVDQAVADYLRQAQVSGQQIEFSKDMWFAFLEQVIDIYVRLEKAELDSVTVSDSEVQLRMDERVNQLIIQAGSEQALERAFGKSIIQLKADFREDFREQLLASRVQQLKIQTINITRPEVTEFFESIPKDSLPTIPEQVALSQIVTIPPPLGNAKEEAHKFAQQLRDSIVVHGKTIEELAKRHSADGSANNGGKLPLMSLDELVSEYSAAASALNPGGISEVVETQFGFHIIKLNRRVGDKIETNHILITVDEGEMNEEFAINRLNEIRDSLMTIPDLKFSAMARKESEDPYTANAGGKIFDPETGERLIALNRLEPAMYRIVLLMDEVGQISEPKSFTPENGRGKAYRIVRLDNQILEHTANLDQDYDRIRNIALQRKQGRIMQKWMEDLREDIYVEYKISVPKVETTL